MRIAQIAPLTESVPPKLYGGSERIVSYLTEELARRGHAVTLFASGDSRTAADLVPCSRVALRHDPAIQDSAAHHMIMLDRVRRQAASFDVLHFHIDGLHYPLFRDRADRTVTTLHGRLDLPDQLAVHREFTEFPLVSISDDQRRPMPPARWLGTVYHGLPQDLHALQPNPKGDYLAFLGRICPEKRADRAIEIARASGVRLKIAAKIDPVDRAYFHECIRPLLDDPLVAFVGEIGEAEKQDFLGNARAVLFPIDWPEPFGLVMIEAMACGTPVIAFRHGSVPEIIDDGITGFVVEDVEQAVEAVRRVGRLDRRAVRRRFAARFSVERMTSDYLACYRRIAAGDVGSLRMPPAVRAEGARANARR